MVPIGGPPPRHAAEGALLAGRGRFNHHGVGGPLDRQHLDRRVDVFLDGRVGWEIGVHLHAEKALLQLAVGRELGRAHRARDAAVHHHVDGIGDVDRDAEVLLDQQHRDLALGGERLQHRDDLLHDERGQAFGRLVHDQQLGVEEQRACDRQHLLLAAGQLGTAVGSALGEPGERLVDAFDRPRAPAPGQPEMLVNG